MNKKLILASTSPRRQELLKLLDVPFEIIESAFEESISQDISPEKLVQELAFGKASDVASRIKNAIIIGGDSVVTLEGKTLGKPKSKEEAHEMLQMTKGKKQTVYTGTSIIDSDTLEHEEFTVSLDVHFRNFSDEDLNWYLSTDEPYDKAGAYAIQGKGSVLIDRVEGDFIGAIGLPIKELFLRLPKFGIKL